VNYRFEETQMIVDKKTQISTDRGSADGRRLKIFLEDLKDQIYT
jgi:hypothetical protein